MMRRRISSLGACSDSDSVTGRPSFAKSYILGTSPQVDSDTFLREMLKPSGSLTSRRNLTTLS